MKTSELLQSLSANPAKEIKYTLNDQQLVPAHYHVTEVMATNVTSIDCGGKVAKENYTNIQLWTGTPTDDGHRLNAGTFAGILKKAIEVSDLDIETPTFFEYGDNNFHTARLSVSGADFSKDQIEIKLDTRRTACKPIKNALAMSENCCAPASNCC